MKRFLFVSPHTFPEQSGSGINAFNFASYINASDNIATIFSYNRKNKFNPRTVIRNTTIIRAKYYNQTLISKLLSLFIIMPCFIRQLFKHDIVLIYGNKIIAYEIFILFAKAFGKKVVFRSLLFGIDDLNTITQGPGIKQKFYLRLFSMIDLYYSINKKFSEAFKQNSLGAEKLFENPQGVDTELFYPNANIESKKNLKEKLGLPGHGIIILMAGFLLKRKKYAEVFSSLAKLKVEYRLVVLGEYNFSAGHFLARFKEESLQIKKMGEVLLGKKIRFCGFVNNPSEYMRASDIFIHNSENEVPNVILEAMASGLVVLAKSSKDFTRGFLTHRHNCLLYDQEDEIPGLINQTLSGKLQVKEMRNNAVSFIQENYTFNNILQKLLNRLYC